MEGAVKVIVNPTAGHGRTGRMWPDLRSAMESRGLSFSFELTKAPWHAAEMAREAALAGAATIIVVGGDGTVNEVVNGLFDSGKPVSPGVTMGVVATGSGCDLVRTLGFPREPGKAVDALVRGRVIRADVGLVRCRGFDGSTVERHFLNVGDVGLGGDTAAVTNRMGKAMGGFISFLFGAVLSIARYRNKEVRLVLDGEEMPERRVVLVAAANGRYLASGMKIAPDARIDDGLFDVVIVGDLTRLGLLRNIPKIYPGTHLRNPKVRVVRARRLEVFGGTESLLELDGEIPGCAPATFEIVPGALQLIAADLS
ncbi:MAG: diacylglycerol kinase family lipid kinase [Firmicutes bacterium]|nr:diacylglycerol kinase family lipid kinase [Bacillota bacterium]